MRLFLMINIAVGLLLSGCGFALRGTATPLPARFEKTYFADQLATDDSFERRIKQLIVLGGGTLVERDIATVSVAVSEINTHSRQIAISGSGTTKEYERDYTATVTVVDLTSGAQLGSRKLSTTRNIQLNDSNALASEAQSTITQNDAEGDLAKAVMQYLKTF